MDQINKYQEENVSLQPSKSASFLLIIGIIFIAANSRSPLTAVGPVVDQIRGSLHISNTLTGMITTFPLIAFAAFSPFVPKLARRFGAKLVLLWSLVFLTFGIVLRSLFGENGLFFGTAIIGLSISVGNVLMPSLIKHDFPKRIGIMTGIYNVSMSLFGAIASGVSIPISTKAGLGWEGSLSIWSVLSFLSFILWIPQVMQRKRKTTDYEGTVNSASKTKFKACCKGNNEIKNAQGASRNKVNLWKSPLAWQVTLYMGLQSVELYCMYAWLPDILVHQGMDTGKAGWMLSLFQLTSLPIAFLGSVLAGRKANQRPVVIVASLCVLSGLFGIFFGATGLTFLWMILMGSGCALTFSLSLIFFSFRTKNADEAARLSGMAQSVGYLLASLGPTLLGFLHDATNNWTLPLAVLIGAASMCLLVGLGASRDLQITSTVGHCKSTLHH